MYSTGPIVNPDPKTPYIPSTSSTSITSTSSASSSSYSLMPPVNLLTPPSSNLISAYKNHKYNYESNHHHHQQFIFNTPTSTPTVQYIPHMSYYQKEMESSRMVPASSVSPSGSLSDTTELSLNNTKQYSKSDYYITKREKLIPTSTSKTNLYIRGLLESTTDDDLYEMCKKFGEIKSTKAIIDKQTLKCKGYGFVDFKSLDDAKTALNELKKEQKDVQLAKQREQDPTNLYFANLPGDIDEKILADMLKNRFSANVNSTRIMRERCGSSKGVGFARLDDNKLCDEIIQQLNNRPFPDHQNHSRIISVKLADSGGIVKPKFKNNNTDKDNLNNTINSNHSNGYNSNDSNNNYSQNNYNYPSSPSYPVQHPPPYPPQYMEHGYPSYPIVIENYQSGATIVSQPQPQGQIQPTQAYQPIHRMPYIHQAPIMQHQSPPSQTPYPVQAPYYQHPPHHVHPMPYYYYHHAPHPYMLKQQQNDCVKQKQDERSSSGSLSQQFSSINLNQNEQ